MAPLPWERTLRHFGLGTRTWQFTLPLLEAGHHVFLVAKKMLDAYADAEESPPDHDTPAFPNLTIERFDAEVFHDVGSIRVVMEKAEPDCVLGINMEAASMACLADPAVPIWADLNGYTMGEAQARHKAIGDQDDPFILWGQLLPILLRADVFSAVSEPQRLALIAELGSVGRLTGETFGYEFVYRIQNAVPPHSEDEWEQSVGSGLRESEDEFWVLWSGGFNTWADVETLVAGVEGAMAQAPDLRFVSSGGGLGDHDPKTYRRFCALVNASAFKERFHILGWVPGDRAMDLYRQADLGINIDFSCYETEFGARNRINSMLRFGLPVLTTYGTEISRIVEGNGLGLVIDCEEPKALTSALVWACRNRDRLQDMGNRGRELVLERFTYARTTKRVQSWVAAPTFSPDNLRKRAEGKGFGSELERRASLFGRIGELEEDSEELRRIYDTRAFRLYHRLKELLRL